MCICSCGAWAAGFRTPFSDALEKNLRARPSVSAHPQTGRFRFMRFYVPREYFLQGPGFWERLFGSGVKEQRVRAMAFYLLQMYVSCAAYGEDMPSVLNADYLGALDGFAMLDKPFDFKKATSFYQENKTEIKEYLRAFFQENRLLVYRTDEASNDKREAAFVSLLGRSAAAGFPKGAYRISFRGGEEAETFVPSDALAAWMKAAAAEAKQKVVLFEVPEVSLADFDSPLASAGSKMGYYYRYVIDECYYLSYLLSRRIVQDAGSRSVRQVYRLSVRPLKGAYLRSSRGEERFRLASGAYSAQWDYHTVTLLVLEEGKGFSLEVADRFLFGEVPVSLQTWLGRFDASNTVLSAEPFYRNETVENAIKTPQRKRGADVVVDGKTYKPHPVRR